ncbi:MAG: Yop proteins translocation protein L [Chlamydiae bacterium]|nr:Yop proteins translocation protein L [Chlamydiota bacterium]
MNLFTLIEKGEIHPTPDKKVIPKEEFSKLIEAHEIVNRTRKEEEVYRARVTEECEQLKEGAERAGFEAGLQKWNELIEQLDQEIITVRGEMEKSLVPLALTAVKKILGRELKAKPESVVDIVTTALKTVTQHRKISIYVNKSDLDQIEKERNRIKALFEHLESLSIVPRDDVSVGGCIIETEAGIINAQLESQLKALESAFTTFFHNQKKRSA